MADYLLGEKMVTCYSDVCSGGSGEVSPLVESIC